MKLVNDFGVPLCLLVRWPFQAVIRVWASVGIVERKLDERDSRIGLTWHDHGTDVAVGRVYVASDDGHADERNVELEVQKCVADFGATCGLFWAGLGWRRNRGGLGLGSHCLVCNLLCFSFTQVAKIHIYVVDFSVCLDFVNPTERNVSFRDIRLEEVGAGFKAA